MTAALKTVTGQDWTVRIEKAAGGEQPVPTRPTPAVSTANRQKTLLEHPLFKRIADRLGGQMVRVEDGFNPVAVVKKPAVPADLAAAAVDDGGEAPIPESEPETDEA